MLKKIELENRCICSNHIPKGYGYYNYNKPIKCMVCGRINLNSKIFTSAEYQSLQDRIRGIKSDKTGIFSSRVKPKIIEILEYWFPQKKKLQKLVASASKKKNKKEVRHSSH